MPLEYVTVVFKDDFENTMYMYVSFIFRKIKKILEIILKKKACLKVSWKIECRFEWWFKCLFISF